MGHASQCGGFHPSNIPHDIPICWDTTSFSVPPPSQHFKHSLPLPLHSAEQTPLLRLGSAPGNLGKLTEGLPLSEIKAGTVFVTREGWANSLAFIFTCFSLGCCFAAWENWNQRAALGLRHRFDVRQR